MEATNNFKIAIANYFAKRIEIDENFALLLAKPGKNIDDCVTYILNKVKTSGKNAFTDAEIYGMAVHYFDEDNIDVGNPVQCTIVHAPETSQYQPETLDQEEFEEEPETSQNQLSLF